MNSESEYKYYTVESYESRAKSSRHGNIHIRPVEEEGFSPEFRVECSKELKNTDKYDVGTRFIIRAKLKDGGTHLYSHHKSPFEVVKPKATTKKRKKVTKNKANSRPDNKIKLSDLHEGSVVQLVLNRYERDASARKICIDHFGIVCLVCGFDFQKTYGKLGKDFIHVHHIIPLAKIGKRYVVDPLADLRPVCPNCHAMLHRRDPPYEIDELRALIT
jgi:hypothetical protein